MLQAFDRHQQQELKKAHVKIVKGFGSFVNQNTIEISRSGPQGQTPAVLGRRKSCVGPEGRRQVVADRILICTGASRKWPDGSEYKERVTAKFPENDERFMTTDQMNKLSFLPKRLGIIGTGIMAVEFSAIFAKCGTEVQFMIHILCAQIRFIPVEYGFKVCSLHNSICRALYIFSSEFINGPPLDDTPAQGQLRTDITLFP